MRCSDIREKLSSYLDGMLSPEEMGAVDQHLSLCPECERELQLLEQTVDILQQVEEVEPPADLKEMIMASLPSGGKEKKSPGSFWARFSKKGPLAGLGVAAACLVLVVVFWNRDLPLAQLGSIGYDTADEAPSEEGITLTGQMIQPDSGAPQEMARERAEMEFNLQEDGALEDRKVIKRATLVIEVEDLDEKFQEVVELAESRGGFVQHSGTWDNERQRFSSFTLRVPAPEFNLVMAQLEELGRVERREMDGRDVTEEFVDTEARLRNLKQQEERFLDILEKADTVEDILSIERELERVRSEIEALQARLQNLENMTSLATINIELRQLKVSGERISPPGVNRVIDSAFQATISTVNWLLYWVGELVVFIGRLLPLVPLLVLGWWGYRRYRRRGKSEQ